MVYRKLALVVGMLLLVLPAFAQENPNVHIDFPPAVYDVAGTVDVRGTVNPPNLQSYFLEAAEYPSPAPQWIPVSLPSNTPVSNGVLAQWVTTVLPDGIYQLRLRAVLTTGETVFAVVAPIRVANHLQRPAGEGVTVPSSPTLAPTLVPQATALPQPTTAATPMINQLPVPVGGHVLYLKDTTAQLMRNAGMTWAKWQLPFLVNSDADFLGIARDRIALSRQQGFKVLLSITGDMNELRDMGKDYYPKFAEYLGKVAQLHPDAIEVWNEMNLDRQWPAGRIDPRAYADMLKQAYTAIKAADLNIMVITGALAPTGAEGAFGLDHVWNDDRYYQGMANAGVANTADCIGVHYNEGIISPKQRGGDPRVPDYPTRYFLSMSQRAAFPFRSSPIPLCYTELGYLTPEGYGPLPAGFEWAANTTVQEQATWLHDAIQLAAQFQTKPIALIIIWNIDFDQYDKDPQAGYAIIRPDGSCPACQTIGSLRGPA
jgi:hypothetical protein